MNVLLTKKLAQDQLDLIQSWGWNYEVVETLKITLLKVNEVPTNAEAWIISSRNSFEAIQKFIEKAPQRIYCVGAWVKNEIEKLSAKVSVVSFENMKSLASEVTKENFRDVTYFCGREHRTELEEELKGTSIKLTKMITYESEMTFPVIKNAFDVVFVFSPRSAESLLKHNYFPQTIFACIGATTAGFLHSRGITSTFVPSYPDARRLLEEFHNSRLTAVRKKSTT